MIAILRKGSWADIQGFFRIGEDGTFCAATLAAPLAERASRGKLGALLAIRKGLDRLDYSSEAKNRSLGCTDFNDLCGEVRGSEPAMFALLHGHFDSCVISPVMAPNYQMQNK